MLLARGEDMLWEIGAQDYLMDPVGCGQFGMEDDKEHLAPIVLSLLRGRLSRSFAAGKFEDCRNLLAWCAVMTDGLPTDWRAAIPPDLLEEFSRPGAPFWGRAPLLVAAGIGDTALMESMIRSSADVACRLRRNAPAFFHRAGQQPLHFASMHGHIDAAALLLESRVQVDVKDRLGETPLMLAAVAGKTAMLMFLLSSRADPNYADVNGVTAMHSGCVFDRPEVVQPLLVARANCIANQHGTSALHNGITMRAGVEVVRSLISAGTGLDDQMRPLPWSRPWIVMSLLSATYRLGFTHTICARGYHSWGATPLMIGIIGDNVSAVWELVMARADVRMRNDRNKDALQLAKMFGRQWAIEIVGEHCEISDPASPRT